MKSSQTWRFVAQLGAAVLLAIGVFFPAVLDLLGSLRIPVVGIGFVVVALELAWFDITESCRR